MNDRELTMIDMLRMTEEEKKTAQTIKGLLDGLTVESVERILASIRLAKKQAIFRADAETLADCKQNVEKEMNPLITEYIDVVREQMKKPDASLVTINDSIRLLERHIHNVKIGAIRISQMED
ncbi:hypothetical protein [Selenomonas sp. AE3005]|uniref:hypothetical protein n=1 Tax=Selenomonas sp. AE3005 TaxID=1485543 RepID=UPI002600B200|nr:hypothetical protein [Selenomonas sp. AE3005]